MSNRPGRGPSLGIVAGILVAAAAAYFVWFRGTTRAAEPAADSVAGDWTPTRPDRPPEPGRDKPRRVREPKMPPNVSTIHAEAYKEAKSAGTAQPGETAFRATVDAFVDYNKSFAEAQAKQEGLTIPEVRELTYFGLMVQETQRWPEVEGILGRELSAEERQDAEQLMHAANSEFKAKMRDLVAKNAGEEARWELIQATQERYKSGYFELTGMTPALLDDLLAGDITRTGAPIATPPPEDIPPGPEYTPPAPRPDSAR